MQIAQGLVDSMVLQRSRKGVGDTRFAGTCGARGRVLARVTKAGKPVAGFAAREVGRAGKGRFEGTLAGLPPGGPYAVELSIVDAGGKAVERAKVRDVFVGDVWIAAGQSNMQGCGVVTRPLPKLDAVRAFYMDDVWRAARDPIHNMWDCVDEVHVALRGGVRPEPPARPNTGVGPAVAFAQEMFRRTRVPQGVLACAHGGTSMAQWNPALGNLGGKSLYGATLRRLAKNGGRVAGVIWYQGESDADGEACAVYTKKMKELVAAFRRDTGDAGLPFALVQISRVVGSNSDADGWNSIQDQERLLPRTIRGVTTVPAIDLDMDDLIHISGRAHQEQLGPRLAQAMAAVLRLPGAGKPPIELDGVTVKPDPRTGLANLVVRFRNVMGKLDAPGRPSGFALSDPRPVAGIFRTTLRGSSALVETTLAPGQLAGKYFNYGIGIDPHCNVADSAGRSLPAFSRIPLAAGRAMTPFVHVWRRTGLLAAPAKFADIALPAAPTRRFESPRDFCDLHVEIEKVREDRVVYFACRINCPEDMLLVACFGYDGPVKLWADGREVFADPQGTNPAIVDRAKVPLDASRGTHDFTAALHTHGGRAWGIYLRFERRGVSKKLLRTAPEQVVLPAIVEME